MCNNGGNIDRSMISLVYKALQVQEQDELVSVKNLRTVKRR